VDVVEANLSLQNLGGAVTDAQVPNTITLDNITQITTRSHTSLSDIGTNTHPQIDTHIAAANPHSGSQPLDALLTALAALVTSADKFPYFTGVDTVALADLSAAMRTFLTTPSSANLAALVTDETGSGLLVFATSPTLTTPTIADFTNAQHDHLDADDGGTLTIPAVQATQTDVFFGRDTVGAGAGEEITVAAAKTLLNLAGTNTGDQTITLTGDVTGSGTGSFAATIANDAVTFAKMQNVSTDILIGRDAAGVGDPEQIAIGGGLEFTGVSGIRTSAFTGDVTKNAGGTALTIANDAVTNAKAADMATQTIKGRTTAGTGDPEDLTAAQTRTVLDVPSNAEAILDTIIDAKGDIIVGTAADTPGLLQVGAHANGEVLTLASGEATGLKWAAAAGGGFDMILGNVFGA
jgi:hypothetical protein